MLHALRSVLVIMVAAASAGCGSAPPASPAGSPPAACPAGDTSVRCLVGPEAYDRWAKDALREDASGTPADVDRSVALLSWQLPDEYRARFRPYPGGPEALLRAVALNLPEEQTEVDEHDGAKWTYYDAKIVHHRSRTNERPERRAESTFTEHLTLVRVRLPATTEAAKATPEYRTNVGKVKLHPSVTSDPATRVHHGTELEAPNCKRDHWYGSVEEFKWDWGSDQPPHPRLQDVTRVDLVTTANFRGNRFSAIGFYLAYVNENDAAPAFYAIEAGNAFNAVRQIYLAEGVSQPDHWSGPGVARGRSTYNPTRLSNPQNYFASLLTGVSRGQSWDPDILTIRAFHSEAEIPDSPYVMVKATFTPSPAAQARPEGQGLSTGPSYFDLMCRAGGRVWKIERAAQPGGAEVMKWYERMVVRFCKSNKFDLVPQGPQDPPAAHGSMQYEVGRCDSGPHGAPLAPSVPGP